MSPTNGPSPFGDLDDLAENDYMTFSFIHHDRVKARAVLARQSKERVSDLLRNYGHDAFVPAMTEATEPAISLGTAETAAGTKIPVRVSLADAATHWAVAGTTGAGKTSFAALLMSGMLGEGLGVGGADFKSGFWEDAIARAGAYAYRLPRPEQAAFVGRVQTIRPSSPDALHPFNIVQPPTGISAETWCYETAGLFEELYPESGFQMRNCLVHALLLATDASRVLGVSFTLLEVIRLLRGEDFRTFCLAHASQPSVREYFGRFAAVPQSSKEALLARLEALVLPEGWRLMFGADECVDLKRILDDGHPLFLFLGRDGSTAHDLVRLFANLALLRLFEAAFAAGGGRARPYFFFLDEPFHVLTPSLSEKFTLTLPSLRHYGVFLVWILHYMGQLDGRLREALLTLTRILVTFRTEAHLTQDLGDFLPYVDRDVLRETLRHSPRPPGRAELRGQMRQRLSQLPDRTAYWYDKRKPYPAFRFGVADVRPPHELAGCSRAEFEEFLETSGLRRGAGVSRETLRRQISERDRQLRELMTPPIIVTTVTPPPSRGRVVRRSKVG
jgi:Helicase HerA, central domain